ncbi:MAG: hypothetical protein ACO3UV_13150 [Pseudomonadales bacterium]
MARLTKEQIEIVKAMAMNPEVNKHMVKWPTIRERIQRHGWTIEDAFSVGTMSKKQAGQRAAMNPKLHDEGWRK